MTNQIYLYSQINQLENESGFDASFPEGIDKYLRLKGFNMTELDCLIEPFMKSTYKIINFIFQIFYVYGFNKVIEMSYNKDFYDVIDNIRVIGFTGSEQQCELIHNNMIEALQTYLPDVLYEFKADKHSVYTDEIDGFLVALENTHSKDILKLVNKIMEMGAIFARQQTDLIQQMNDEAVIWRNFKDVLRILYSEKNKEVRNIKLGNLIFVDMVLSCLSTPYLRLSAEPQIINEQLSEV